MSAPKESQQNKELDDILRLVRDAGAIDDNMGAEDWRASDLAIDQATAALTVLLNRARKEARIEAIKSYKKVLKMEAQLKANGEQND